MDGQLASIIHVVFHEVIGTAILVRTNAARSVDIDGQTDKAAIRDLPLAPFVYHGTLYRQLAVEIHPAGCGEVGHMQASARASW